MRKSVVVAGVMALFAGSAIAAPNGAPQDAAMQSGGWGANGWQSGTPAAPGYAAPAYAASGPMQPSMGVAAGPYAPPPMMAPPHPHGDYRPVHPGQKLKSVYSDPALMVRDWRDWGLGAPGPEMRWIRYYDDAVLVDPDGRVVTVRPGIDWDTPHRRSPYGYAAGGGGMPPHGWYGPHHPPMGPMPGTTTVRTGPHTIVTTTTSLVPPPVVYGGAPAYAYGGGYGYAPGSVVTVTPGVVTTVTTTTEEREWHSVMRRQHHAIRRGKLVRR